MYSTTTVSRKKIIIDETYCGPPGIGNGGYVAGRLAQAVAADGCAVQVTLFSPTFVGRPVSYSATVTGAIELYDGHTLLAEAAVAPLELEVPLPPSWPTAAAARLSYRGRHSHPFAHCFVCGPRRRPGDGLRIFAGLVDYKGLYAAPWKPHRNLSDDVGYVKPEFIWSALDCPGAFAAMGEHVRPLLLGRITAQIDTPLAVENEYVISSWLIAQNGRKHEVGTAIFTPAGRLKAKAKATWFDLK